MSTTTTKPPCRIDMTKEEEANLEWNNARMAQKRLETKATTTTTPPPKPKRTAAGKCSATPTSLLCQLMRLKAQQKYLECNQVKLQPNNFQLDQDDDEEETEVETEVKAQDTAGPRRRPSSVTKVTNLINDIEHLKLDMAEKLQKHHLEKHGQLQGMWYYMNTLKEDVFRPERLSQYSVNAMRDRIVAISGQLERLKAQNARELEMLREEYTKLERENRYEPEAVRE